MDIAISHNNLNKFGGGEKVAITLIDELYKQGHSITIYTNQNPLKKEIESFYNIKIDDINFINVNPVKTFKRAYYADYILSKRLSNVKDYDIIIDTSSNGFYPIKNKNAKVLCYVHFPMLKKPNSPLLKLYLSLIYYKIGYSYKNYDKVIANSNFSKNYIEMNLLEYNQDIEVIYPPVTLLHSPNDFKELLKYKENQILVVGRFAPEKKILFLIEQFKKIHNYNKNYKMHIVGSPSTYHNDYFKKIKDDSRGYPIEIHNKITKDELDELYKKSQIYWHAKGYKESDPVMHEHFGITTVEAMNNGCIPIVINKGGQKEIVDNRINGFLWNNDKELNQNTLNVIKGNINLKETIREAINKTSKFDEKLFRKKFIEIIEGI